MLDVDQRAVTNPSSITQINQWFSKNVGLPGISLQIRLRGNDLHILFEGRSCPTAITVVPKVLQALVEDDSLLAKFGSNQPIYQVILYGRVSGNHRPDWIEAIHLHQLDWHLEKWQIQRQVAETAADKKTSALVVSNETLARSGSPNAIAYYLSEILSALGVSVKVLVQNLPQPQQLKGETATKPNLQRRLWVICDSDYSPDSSLLAEPITERLRNLKLEGFQDAVIKSQVRGEVKPEWLLRVDLTPPEEMLKDWARWGDPQAIAELLNQALADKSIQVQAFLKTTTIHLFCSPTSDSSAKSTAPIKERTLGIIKPLLESFAPQGIYRAAIYGIKHEHQPSLAVQERPTWVEWLNLPASEHPALAETPLELAQKGDEAALIFLLQQLLNPDLNLRLKTGGIAVQIRRRQDLLHIMTEATACPLQSQVGHKVAKFMRQTRVARVAGVRVYGRRAGQLSPLWSYGVDFVSRTDHRPEKAPEFVAVAAVPRPESVSVTEESVLPSEEISASDDTFSETADFGKTLQQWFLASRLFIPASQDSETANIENTPIYAASSTTRNTIICGAIGLLLLIQSDWLIGYFIKHLPQSQPVVASSDILAESEIEPESLPKLSLQKSQPNKLKVFNSSGFTSEGDTSVVIDDLAEDRGNGSRAAIVATARSRNPSFNNRILDEKLALYQQRLQQNGGVPPEVLIVGSSRAMRGVDPSALKAALTQQGYSDIQIFNFGINGATAQVVDLLIRRILNYEQLPKLIIWADGARAFNSSRVDLTYDAMANSAGYQQLSEQEASAKVPHQAEEQAPAPAPSPRPASNSSGFNNSLNQLLANISATYPQREQLKTLFREKLASVNSIFSVITPPETSEVVETDPNNISSGLPAMDFDGYMPISIRFDTRTYYQNHPKVSGDYDNDYESFNLEGKQELALNSLLEFVQAKQVPLVFVNMPLTKEYLDPVRSKYEQEFQKYMRQISLEKGLIFRDLSQLWPARNSNFSDPSHLNRYGAIAVSEKLAQDPMIPWSNK